MILSFGPAVHWTNETTKIPIAGVTLHVPLPYAAFYYLVPGFQAFRTPSRFFLGALLFALLWVSSKVTKKIALLALLIAWLVLPTLPLYTLPSINQYPPSVTWLAARPEKVALYLPMRDWVEPAMTETFLQMLYSLEAKKQLVNGQSGFYPADYQQFLSDMKDFPSKHSIDRIKARGVELIIIDKDYYRMRRMSVEVVYEDKEIVMYKVR